jgi:alkylhydroperoxidase family enzyme
MVELTYVDERKFERTRIPPVRREDLSHEEQAFFDQVTSHEGDNGEYRAVQRRHYYRMLLQSPRFAAKLLELGQSIVDMPSSRRNLALITVAADAPCHFLLMGHIADSIATGVRPEAIRAILDNDERPLTPSERLLSRFARQIVHLEVTDETFAEVEAMLGPRATVDYVASVNMYRVVVQFSSALGIPQTSRAEIDELLTRATDLAATGTPGFSIETWHQT